MVFDGLGYEYLLQNGHDSCFHKHLRGSLTSVFPSTTATAITTFATGMAPLQHAITGWFVHLKELGAVTTVLPFTPRAPSLGYGERISMQNIFNLTPAFLQLSRKAYVVNQARLVNSVYSKLTTPNTERIGYQNLEDFFSNIANIVTNDASPKYIYGYWPAFDSLCHEHGTLHPATGDHFHRLDEAFGRLIETLRDSDSVIIATADHGLINTTPDKTIHIEDHPQLQNTLTLPLCGEPRTAYCYVKPGSAAQFESYLADHLGHCCDVYPSEQLVNDGFFGLDRPNAHIWDRIGDYTLIMKDNYIIKDLLQGEKPFAQVGVHGGVSKWEMRVPLVVKYC
jgi:predicted AlkP superfamily pyrophosphatase or phosphodiesterase